MVQSFLDGVASKGGVLQSEIVVAGGNMENHFRHSSLRESVPEKLFLAALMRALWQRGDRDFAILHAATDANGYDLVVETRGILRHIQLKSSCSGARTCGVKVNTALADRPSGCVVWMVFDAETLEFTCFRWFGAGPGERLPDLGSRIAKHTKANAQGIKALRPNIRVLPATAFVPVPGIAELTGLLFGLG